MEFIQTDNAPAAVGPYSQATKAGGFVFCSGQLGLIPGTKDMEQGVAAQARRALENAKAVLEAAGSGLTQVVKVTVFLTDMADFPAVNQVYEACFGGHQPARSTFQVAGLPLGGLVEMEMIALAP